MHCMVINMHANRLVHMHTSVCVLVCIPKPESRAARGSGQLPASCGVIEFTWAADGSHSIYNPVSLFLPLLSLLSCLFFLCCP